MTSRFTKNLAVATTLAFAFALSVGLVTVLTQEEEGGEDRPVEITHNVLDADAPIAGAVFGSGTPVKPGVVICSTPTQNTANVDTDCEKTGPSNETSIAVNPTNENNIIGGANDYQLGLNPGGHVTETIHSRAHVTFDGGKTWSEYPILFGGTYQGTGDPALAFDASGHAYYATLGFRFVGPANALNPDVLVANSGDGGKTWTSVRVAEGSGNFGSVGDLLDKEYIAAWGNGNAIVTFGDFRLGQKGSFVSGKIYSVVTHDGGATWSKPQLISGTLDQAFVSVPTVAADGRIYVAFLNTTNLANGRDDYEVVEVSPSTGALVFGPVKVATTIDGFTDYPLAFGRQTYHDSLFRTWAAGNITADPKNPAHLAVVWSDMAIADFDGDGHSDIAGCPEDLGCFVFFNDGTGTFGNGVRFDTPKAVPYSMIATDLNRDGRPDILVGYVEAPGVAYFNNGTGQSYRPERFGDGSGAIYGMAAADLNGDGWPDVVVARSDAPSFVMFNRAPTQ